MAELRIPIIVENKGKKALADVDKGVKGLSKSFKKLAGAAGIGLSAKAVIDFGKKAAKAFMEDEKAASRLAIAVKNLGLGFETPRIEKFISELSRMSGITDDQLRPAMQSLLQTTGSVTKSQELLTQALDISRGSGIDYETVIKDLSMAYLGNTKGLSKYSLGLSKAELKTMKFADVQEKLAATFKGSNAAYLTTYAGQMELLNTAAGEATESIGEGLVTALQILAGEGNTIQPLADSMADFGTYLGDAIIGTGVLIDKLNKIPGIGKRNNRLGDLSGYTSPIALLFTALKKNLDVLSEEGAKYKAARAPVTQGYLGSMPIGIYPNAVDEAKRRKAEADAIKRQKELAAITIKGLAEAKKKAALDKASKILNLEAIGIEAALKGKISETDRISLLLQKAILEGNASLATKLSDQLNEATKRNEQLRLALLATPKAPNPYENWKIPDDVLAWTAASLGMTVSSLGTTPVPISSSFSDAQMELAAAVNAGQAAEQKLINVQVYLDGDIVGGAITNSQVNSSLSG
jgi:hypothetical protein